ncbi:hypothetical protein IAT40_004992 [Kwoniella sp. CBS 6097]
MPAAPSSPLSNLSQTIHATLLSPPRQFLLTTSTANDYLRLSLFTKPLSSGGSGSNNGDRDEPAHGRVETVMVWTAVYDLIDELIKGRESEMAEAINEGLLHVDCGPRRAVDLAKTEEVHLHILIKPEPIILDLKQAEIGDEAATLLTATYTLLSAPKPSKNPKDKDNTSEVRDLQAQLFQKDAEIATLNSRLASMKATVVRATASDNKKVQQSPQKVKPPANASKLQPNQKRRKAVEDEFAGSSDEEEEDF